MLTNDFTLCATGFSHFLDGLPDPPAIAVGEAPMLVVLNSWYETPVPFYSAILALGARVAARKPVVFIINDVPYPDQGIAESIQLIAGVSTGLTRFGPVRFLSDYAKRSSAAAEEIKDAAAQALRFDLKHRIGFDILHPSREAAFPSQALPVCEATVRAFAGALETECPDSVLLPGGVANTMHGLMTLARNRGIRVATYDSGAGTPRVYVSGHDVACQGWEVPGLVEAILRRANSEELAFCRRMACEHADRVATGTDDMLRFPFVVPKEQLRFDALFITSMEQDSSLLSIPGLFDSQEEWLTQTITALRSSHPQSCIAVRQHPDERRLNSRYGERAIAAVRRMMETDPLITLFDARDDTQTRSLMASASVVLSAGSTAGIEAGMLGRPVISHVRVNYSQTSFCRSPQTPKAFFDLVRAYVEAPSVLPDNAVIESEIFYYVKNHCWRVETPVTPDPPIFRDWIAANTSLPFNDEAYGHIVQAIAHGKNLCALRHAANLRPFADSH
ncbi:capsular polysaccharide export protein, LipB/KpsS family [Azospirillum doebereinerae]